MSIREDDEYIIKKPVMPNHNLDENLAELKRIIPLRIHYNAIYHAFEMLAWGPDKKSIVKGAHSDGNIVLIEENFVRNIKHVIGVDEPYFGKMLYLWMSNGYDRQKITITEFIEWLMPFRGDNK